jgi:hypothetical protein
LQMEPSRNLIRKTVLSRIRKHLVHQLKTAVLGRKVKHPHLLFLSKIMPPYLPSQRPPLHLLQRNSALASLLIPLLRPLVSQLPPPSPQLSQPLSIPHHPRALESFASTILCACSARSVLEFCAPMAGTNTNAKTAAAAAYVNTKSSEFIA